MRKNPIKCASDPTMSSPQSKDKQRQQWFLCSMTFTPSTSTNRLFPSILIKHRSSADGYMVPLLNVSHDDHVRKPFQLHEEGKLIHSWNQQQSVSEHLFFVCTHASIFFVSHARGESPFCGCFEFRKVFRWLGCWRPCRALATSFTSRRRSIVLRVSWVSSDSICEGGLVGLEVVSR